MDVGENFALVEYGTASKLYILIKTVHTILLFVVMLVIVKHTSMILRNQARFSEGSRKMHQEAIRGLTVQTVAITFSEIVPVLMLCASFYVRKVTSKPPPHSATVNYGTRSTNRDDIHYEANNQNGTGAEEFVWNTREALADSTKSAGEKLVLIY
ncbi:hypothetical protein OSTOST_07827, partial [Ostertagia ostertagi]